MPDARETGGGGWTRTNIGLAQNQAPDLSATPHREGRKGRLSSSALLVNRTGVEPVYGD